MSKWNEYTESGIYTFFGGLLVLLINKWMFSPLTKELYANPELRDRIPSDAFGHIAFHYLTLVTAGILVVFGVAKLIRGLTS